MGKQGQKVNLGSRRSNLVDTSSDSTDPPHNTTTSLRQPRYVQQVLAYAKERFVSRNIQPAELTTDKNDMLLLMKCLQDLYIALRSISDLVFSMGDYIGIVRKQPIVLANWVVAVPEGPSMVVKCCEKFLEGKLHFEIANAKVQDTILEEVREEWITEIET